MRLYYETDFFSNDLKFEPVNLVITSPSRRIIAESLDLMFEKIIDLMADTGYILLDIPKGYERTLIELYDSTYKRNWEPLFFYLVDDMYPNKQQVLQVITKRGNNKLQTIEGEFGLKSLKANPENRLHRCEFDKDLIRRLVEAYSKEASVVLDPFCGTGMVPRVAHELKRTGIGIDIRKQEVNIEL